MDGLIVLNKPRGISSFSAISKLKKLLNLKDVKFGHAGTLDPFAEGVLLVCMGEATKLSRFLMEGKKTYLVKAKLGAQTDTFDVDGVIVKTCEDIKTIDDLKLILNQFKGNILQFPPIYSALKLNGRALYDYARKGEAVDLKERNVSVDDIEILDFNYPFFDFKVICSKGTYVRSLVNDIGLKLNTFSYVHELTRLESGSFNIDDSYSFDDPINEIKIINMEELVSKIFPYFYIDLVLAEKMAKGYQLSFQDIKQITNILNGVPRIFSLFVKEGENVKLHSLLELTFTKLEDLIGLEPEKKIAKTIKIFNYENWISREV